MLSRSPDASSRSDAQILDAYETIAPIALGRYTVLHRARRTGASHAVPDVAIKRLATTSVVDPEARNLLLAAGHVGRELDSRHLVSVLDVHEAPAASVVMEYVDGVNLAALQSALHPSDVVRYTIPLLVDALHGLKALHERRNAADRPAALVHGAPVARHILVDNEGVGRVVDLTHAVGPDMPWSLRRTARLDPAEMAPEQALAPAQVDARCDLFIVGIVLWESLSGVPLFRGATREETLQNMLKKTIVVPSEMGKRSHPAFDALCLRALSRSRAQRIGSAAELAETLRAAAHEAGCFASRKEIAACVRRLGLMSRASTLVEVPSHEPSEPSRPSSGFSPEARPKPAMPAMKRAGLREPTFMKRDEELFFSGPLQAPSLERSAADSGEHRPHSHRQKPSAWARVADLSAARPANRRVLASVLTLLVAGVAASAGTVFGGREANTAQRVGSARERVEATAARAERATPSVRARTAEQPARAPAAALAKSSAASVPLAPKVQPVKKVEPAPAPGSQAKAASVEQRARPFATTVNTGLPPNPY